MSFLKSKYHHPKLPRNELGLTHRDYEGSLSTLCAGCGHDAVGAALVQACFELSIPAHRIAKLSGIGCSSKAPTYFLNRSHGFNTVHGRMPSVATGASMANKTLKYIGMSGDGDTASIGLGQFAHVVRRRLDMTYIVANNGVYGLTKGQTAATAEQGSSTKKGEPVLWSDIDLATMALQLGATFVARSFSGDKEQMVPLLKAAICHEGFAFIDIISPCVTFNNHATSTRSYDYVREHVQEGLIADFVPNSENITTSYREGESNDISLHDGSIIRLHKGSNGYDARDKMGAINAIHDYRQRGEILTGLLYCDPTFRDMHDLLGTTETPLNSLNECDLCPGNHALTGINNGFR
jgi:2-oxoglutarate ferredoxin oxidoreductase subunit beta